MPAVSAASQLAAPTGPPARPAPAAGPARGHRRPPAERPAAAPAPAARTRAATPRPSSVTNATSCVASAKVRARVTVVQSASRTLIATVRPRRPFSSQPLAQLARQPAQDRLQLGMRRDVLVEGPLGRDRLRGTGLRLDRRVVEEQRPRLQVARPAVAEARRQYSLVGLLQLRHRREAHRRQPLGGLRPDPRQPPGRRRARSGCTPPRAPWPRSRRACPRSEQHFATSRDGPIPTEIWMPVSARTAATSSRNTRRGFSTPVRSAYASSSPIDCTRSSRDRTSDHTSRDFSR